MRFDGLTGFDSAILARMVSWRWIPQGCKTMAKDGERDGGYASPVCAGAFGALPL